MVKLLSLELSKRKSSLLWSSGISSSASLTAHRERSDTERYRPPSQHCPRWNLKVYTSTPPSSSFFIAIFLLLISIHEIRLCYRSDQRKSEKERAVSFPLLSSLPCFFFVRCLRKVSNDLYFHCVLTMRHINHGISHTFPRDFRLYLMILRESCILLIFRSRSPFRAPIPSTSVKRRNSPN